MSPAFNCFTIRTFRDFVSLLSVSVTFCDYQKFRRRKFRRQKFCRKKFRRRKFRRQKFRRRKFRRR